MKQISAKNSIKKNIFRKLKVYDYLNNKFINEDINHFIKKIISLGAGELVINFVDNEGTRTGLYDVDLLKIDLDIEIPIIISGGVNSYQNIKDLFKSRIDAVALGSLLVYFGIHKAVLINYPNKDEKKELTK